MTIDKHTLDRLEMILDDDIDSLVRWSQEALEDAQHVHHKALTIQKLVQELIAANTQQEA